MRTLSLNPVARRLGLALVFTLWFAGVGWGMKLLLDYQVAAGPPAAAPKRWPASSGLARAANGPTLVLLLHPRCPCSRATVGELARIVSHTRGRLAVEVLFVVPNGLDARWAMSDLFRAAKAIPGVHVSLDRLEIKRGLLFRVGLISSNALTPLTTLPDFPSTPP